MQTKTVKRSRPRPIERHSKVDIVIGILSSDAEGYRRWFWANYADRAANEALRAEWARVVGRFSDWELRDGLKRWRAVDVELSNPPTPGEFVGFMAPKHTVASKRGFELLRGALG